MQGETQDNIRWHRKIRHSTRSIDKMTPQHLYNLFLGVFLHSFNKTRKTGMKLFSDHNIINVNFCIVSCLYLGTLDNTRNTACQSYL